MNEQNRPCQPDQASASEASWESPSTCTLAGCSFCVYYLLFDEAIHSSSSQWSSREQWTVGILTSLLFFCSILFHELSHSAIAMHYKIRVVSITLFLFGGCAHRPRAVESHSGIQYRYCWPDFELPPLRSLLWPDVVFLKATLSVPYPWLAQINFAVATFNLLLAFLSMWKIFRAMVWAPPRTSTVLRHLWRRRTTGRYGMMLLVFWLWVVNKDCNQAYGWSASASISKAPPAIASRSSPYAKPGRVTRLGVMNNEVPIINRNTTLKSTAQKSSAPAACHLVITEDRLVGMMNVQALNSVPRSEWQANSIQP